MVGRALYPARSLVGKRASYRNTLAPLECVSSRPPSPNRPCSPEGRRELTHRSEEHTSELQSHRDLHSFPTRRSSDLKSILPKYAGPVRVRQLSTSLTEPTL